jgi:hypothetical protein
VLVTNHADIDEPILFNNVVVPSSNSVKHLGHTLLANTCEVSYKPSLQDFVIKFNAFNRAFSSLSYDIAYYLFKVYCFSLYGCELWKLSTTILKEINVTWRKCCRALLSMPRRTHCIFLPFIANDFGLEFVVLSKKVLFFQKCNFLYTNNSLSNIVVINSPVTSSLLFVAYYLKIDMYSILSISKKNYRKTLIVNSHGFCH